MDRIDDKRIVELSKLYLEMALDQRFPQAVRDASSDTVYALAELEQLRNAMREDEHGAD